MTCLDIPATKSLTVSNKYLNSNINDIYIYIGNKYSARYISYLYFDISSIPTNIKYICATLVLFKKPILDNKDNYCNFSYDKPLLDTEDNSPNFSYDSCHNLILDNEDTYSNFSYDSYRKPNLNNNCTGKYLIYPLTEYFSRYTTYHNRPKYDSSLKKSFLIDEKCVCEEIDITSIVSNWISGKIPNKGLMLKGEKNTHLTNLFSALNRYNNDISFIKIYFEGEKFCIPMTELNCTCSLFPPVKERLS